MEITTTGKLKSGVGKSSGIKRRNKKEASEWFQNLSPAEQLLVKQESNTSSSSKERKPKKEMHERERELLLKRRSEHEALFDMHHRHHCIKNSIKDIIAKTTALSNSYTRVQAKNYVDDVYKMVTV